MTSSGGKDRGLTSSNSQIEEAVITVEENVSERDSLVNELPMINAHCEQSSVYWAQHEKKLYKFRILELSGKKDISYCCLL